MRKFLGLMLGLALVMGTATSAFAFDDTKKDDGKKKKKKDQKKPEVKPKKTN